MADAEAQGGAGAAHTVLSVLRGAEGWLERAGVEAPKRSAELLLGSVLQLSRLQLYLAHDRPLDERERAAMRALVARRGKGEPVAHLLGSWSFRGLELAVSKDVLIPRPETEELVELVLPDLPPAAHVVDLGTGSGAIAIALAVQLPQAHVVAVDVSDAALTIAAANVARHRVGDRVALREGSWWQPFADDETFDLVVSNPPYVDPRAAEGLAEDVRRFEPAGALFTEPGDVGSCYRAIFAQLPRRLRPGGRVVCETGLGAADIAFHLLRATGLADVQLHVDLSGAQRFVSAKRAR